MRLTKPMFWLLTILWFVAATWWYGSCSKCSNCSASIPVVAEKINIPGFNVTDGNWSLATAANLRFGKSSPGPVFDAAITTIFDSVVAYSKIHPDKKFTVTGYYNAGEKNNSSFADLGLARADEIKKWLISKGVAEKNIDTKSVAEDALVFSPADTLVGGIALQFANAAVAPEPAPAAVKDDLFVPHTVYFNTGKNTLPVDPVFNNYIEKAKAYLQNHTDKKLVITGHTDNVGNPEKNKQLSAGRAAFVKSELAKKGIDASRMESIGKGMDEPIADNATAAGKAKNRRVTIQLQ